MGAVSIRSRDPDFQTTKVAVRGLFLTRNHWLDAATVFDDVGDDALFAFTSAHQFRRCRWVRGVPTVSALKRRRTAKGFDGARPSWWCRANK